MATKPNITIQSGDWWSINSTSGIAAGSPFTVQNVGSTSLVLFESITKPNSSSKDGPILSPHPSGSEASITSGSSTIWVRTYNDDISGTLSITTA